MAINNVAIGTSATSLYTSTGQSATTCLFACNTSAGAVTLSLYIVPNGDTVGNSNIVLDELSIPAGDTYIMNAEKIVLENGDSIQGVAGTGSALVSTISYVSI